MANCTLYIVDDDKEKLFLPVPGVMVSGAQVDMAGVVRGVKGLPGSVPKGILVSAIVELRPVAARGGVPSAVVFRVVV